MYWLMLRFISFVCTLFWVCFGSIFHNHGTTATDEKTVCNAKRFETIEVLERFYWKRSSLPWTTEDAKQQNWNQVFRVNEFSLDVYRFKDVNNFFIFFYKNNLVGVGPTSEKQYKDKLSDQHYKDDVNRMGKGKALFKFHATKTTNYVLEYHDRQQNIYKRVITLDGKSFTYALILFVDPDTLRGQTKTPCSYKRIYFEGIENQQWHEAPILENKISKKTPELKKQGCLDRFGHYYFYGLTNDTACRDIHGFFCFYDHHGYMSGFGAFQKGDAVLWESENHPHPLYRFINVQQAKDMVPNNMKCVTSDPTKGFTTINIFLKPDSETKDFECNSEKAKL